MGLNWQVLIKTHLYAHIKNGEKNNQATINYAIIFYEVRRNACLCLYDLYKYLVFRETYIAFKYIIPTPIGVILLNTSNFKIANLNCRLSLGLAVRCFALSISYGDLWA